MKASKLPEPILRLTDGMSFIAGPSQWQIDSLRLYAGDLVAFSPTGAEPIVDAAGPLARVLATLTEPYDGTVELWEKNIYQLEYREVQRLRSKLGFVQGFGGLLSNRTVIENIALPASVHGKLSLKEEIQLVSKQISDYGLENVAEMQPHNVDGATRWRACLARAMILSPGWVVLEGLGDWEMDRGQGIAWQRLIQYRDRKTAAICICLSRKNQAFEQWFEELGGKIINYTPVSS